MENPRRHCVRCGANVHGRPQDQPHLCADIEKRLKRREKQVAAVVEIIDEHLDAHDVYLKRPELLAEKIVAGLANMGVEND
jgi:hypothetical protein